jgi:hypothetical protein
MFPSSGNADDGGCLRRRCVAGREGWREGTSRGSTVNEEEEVDVMRVGEERMSRLTVIVLSED